MGKRSNFERKPRDFYATPAEGVYPLLAHLKPQTRFIEPCAGDGRLIRHLEKYGHQCAYASDIEPMAEGIEKRDVLFFGGQFPDCDAMITNPPWTREIMHQMIETLTAHAPTWLLFDADWSHTVQSIPYKKWCVSIVSVGRISWEGNGVSGMDNCAWYQFDRKNKEETKFFWPS